MKGRPWIAGLLVVSLVVLTVVLVACGSSSSTSTTVAPVTTAAPSTTAAVTTEAVTTEAPTTTEAATTSSSLATTASQATTTSAAATPADLFAANCSCHKSVPKASAAQALQIITNGREEMPSFKTKFTADQIKALAQWVANGGK